MGVKKCPKLRDVIYGLPLTTFYVIGLYLGRQIRFGQSKKKTKLSLNFPVAARMNTVDWGPAKLFLYRCLGNKSN